MPNISKILAQLRKLYPDAQCALEHSSPFELLIATILSAQCTDKRVNLITPALFQQANTPEKMLKLGEKKLSRLIQTCGLYQTKTRNILAACRMLLENHGGEVPERLEELVKLPGVGRKTANVVISNAFDTPAIAVDTHVFRVSQRLGLAKAKTPEQVERQLMEVLPQKDWSEAHHLLIHHGRNLCRARNPLCGQCPLQAECLFFKNSIPKKTRPTHPSA